MGAIIILARSHDPVALALCQRWSAEDVCMVTPGDLSTAGWRCSFDAPGSAVAVAGGRLIPAGEIDGVVTRLPCVFEEDLGHMGPGDRAYAAAEMTAFLLAWLTGLNCPIVNRPTAQALWGPCRRHEKWVQAATELGIPAKPTRRMVSKEEENMYASPLNGITITVLGRNSFGDADRELLRQAGQLAVAAGVDLLTVRFSGAEAGSLFLDASIWPDTITDVMADALLEHLRENNGRPERLR